MSLLQSLQLHHLPPSYAIHVALFHTVSNAEHLHRQLLDGNADFEYAFIDASVIISRAHALAAAFRAVNDLIEGRLRSRNVHSEAVFSLSPNSNISESFRRFGIAPATSSLLVIKISTPEKSVTAAAVQDHLRDSVKGTQVPFEDEALKGITDWARVKKYYKLGAVKLFKEGIVEGGRGSEEQRIKEAELQVLGAMALRGAS